MIRIVFGKIPKDGWNKDDFILTTKKDKEKHYYYLVEQEDASADIKIIDTCGRSFPIDVEHVPELVECLLAIYHREVV